MKPLLENSDAEVFGPKASCLLLPIDLYRCPSGVLSLAHAFVKPFHGRIILLHVVASGGSGTSASDRHTRRAFEALEALEALISPQVDVVVRVRKGVPHEEILSEVTDAGVDFILLPVFAPSLWRRLWGLPHSTTANALLARAVARIFVFEAPSYTRCL